MEHETLNLIWPLVTGALIVPLVAWIKTKLPADFPLQSTAISAVMSLIAVWALSEIFAPEMTWAEILHYALGTQVTSQVVHAAKKTKDKLSVKGNGK